MEKLLANSLLFFQFDVSRNYSGRIDNDFLESPTVFQFLLTYTNLYNVIYFLKDQMLLHTDSGF